MARTVIISAMNLKRVAGSDYLILALTALPAMLPMLLSTGLPNTADGVLHLYRTFELDRAWRDGVLYPRIAPDFAYGYGYPIFNYYAPLFYFFSQALHVVGISLEWAMKAAILITFFLYPLGMYLFARRWLSRGAALAAGVAYLYAPYRFYEAFIQGDYPQFLALALVPFCLWAATPGRQQPAPPPPPSTRSMPASAPDRQQPRPGKGMRFAFVAAYGALLLAHNITALIATPLIGAYIVFVSVDEMRRTRSLPVVVRRSAWTALAIALAVGLTAFFWLPALGEQRYVHIDKLTSGFFDFRKYFLTPAELLSPNIPPDLAGVNPYIPFNVGPVIGLLAAAGLVLGMGVRLAARCRGHCGAEVLKTSARWLATPLWPCGRGRLRRPQRACPGALPGERGAAPAQAPLGFQWFCAAAAAGLAAMTLPVSAPLWEHVPLLVLTEFPWRFVGLAAIPLAMLAGYAVSLLTGHNGFAGAGVHPVTGLRPVPAVLTAGTFAQSASTGLRPAPTSRAFVNGSYVTAAVIALIMLDSFVYLFPRTPFLAYGDPSLSDIAKFEISSQALGTTSAAEYLPVWTQRRMYDSPLTSQLLRDAIPDHLYREALPVTVRVAPLAQTVEREAYRFQSSGPLTVRILRIYFPGWTASIDGQPVPLDLDATATMRVEMPAGEHVVEFRFGETVLRQAADGISLAALAICIGLGVWAARKRAPAGGSSSASARESARSGGAAAVPAGPVPEAEAASGAMQYRIPTAIVAGVLIAFYFVAPHIGFVRFSHLPQIIGMQHARDDRLGDEMRLLGYDLPAPSVNAGETLALTLYWQPLRFSQNDYAVFAHLDNPLTLETVAQTLNDRPGNISTVELPLSLYVRDPHALRVPETVEPGVYLLRAGMLNPRTGSALPATQPDGSLRTRVSLQSVRVRRAAPVDLAGVTRVNARVGPVELLGYTLDGRSQLSLYWRATQTPAPDATVFVHLLAASSQTVATFDGPPAGGLLPISAWEKDEIVVDRRSIGSIAAGNARLAVGLYDPQTLQRWPAQGADGRRLDGDEVVLVIP
jgi:6-pyruvoyl-tetrahydropterin synthase related domain